jgi:hypothetical protein
MDRMTVDVGEYCRIVEDHLTRVNGGHLIRIVGPAFELVRQWAEAGIPASVVFRGIDLKAERHRLGNSTRPLRLEFCEADVREVYRNWRRAVGLLGNAGAESGEAIAEDAAAEGAGQDTDSDSQADQKDRKERRPSMTRHLDRAVDRMSRAMSRADLPDDLREALDLVLQELVELRDVARKARGPIREEIAQRLQLLDEHLAARLQSFAPTAILESVRREAESELAHYRGRLSRDAWPRAVDANADRLLRDRYGLPML